MRILLALIIPSLLVFAPAIWQVIYTIKRTRNKTGLSLGFIFLIALGVQPILTVIAFYISMYGLSYGTDAGCVTGSITFIIIGACIACIVLPLILAAGATMIFSKR